MNNTPFDENTLSRMVRKYVPMAAERLRFAKVLTGKFNTTYSVETGDRPLILRIAPPDDAGFLFYERRMMAQEPEIHSLVLERTSAPVPKILGYDDSRQLIDRDYIVMEKLPGTPLTEVHPLTQDVYGRVLFQTGRYLREIHEITANDYGYLGAHRPMEPQRTWADAFRVMWDKMISDIEATGHYSTEDAAIMRSLLARSLHLFDRPVTSRLLHMDIWHQNILVDAAGNVTGLVDLDRALWGDKEIEFAVLDYCGISEPAFWEATAWSVICPIRPRSACGSTCSTKCRSILSSATGGTATPNAREVIGGR